MSTITEPLHWQAVADGLPDADLNVLLALKGEGSCEGFLNGTEDDGTPDWRGVDAGSLQGYVVTHWAEMPKGPSA